MSRIYGGTGGRGDESARTATAMADVLRQPEWDVVTELVGTNAVLGWTGWSARNVARDDERVLVLDGFVHNRRSLGSADNDAALLLELVNRHGLDEALRRVNGELAVAVLERESGSVLLARDRLGMKPLYYAVTDDGSWFASQPGALLRVPGISHEPDRDFVARFAASHYRTFDNPIRRSPYRAIDQVPAGTVVQLDGTRQRSAAYWDITDNGDRRATEDELAEEYRALLLDAVGIRVASVDRPAFTLSGGMDSSTVLASATELSGRPQDAFSSVYEDPTYDERDEIADMLEDRVGTWHPVEIPETGVPELVHSMVALHHEPVATATWLSHYLLTRDVADGGYDSLFGGLGGDETNAGEFEYFGFFFADLVVSGNEGQLDREIAGWSEHHDHPLYPKTRAVVDRFLAEQVDLSVPGRCLPNRARLDRYVAALDPEYADLRGYVPEMDHPFPSYLKNRTWQDLHRETAPCCVRAEDRHTTAAGLHRFDPFLDHRVVEFAFAVPGTMKIRDGVTKRLLREATKGLLPEATRRRVKKTGWNAPAHRWFTGAGADSIRDALRAPALRGRGIYDERVVEELLLDHERIVTTGAQEENHMMFLWQLLNLSAWLTWLDEQPTPARA